MVLAEAADGTKLRVGAVPNDPLGDGLFWARALEYQLGPYYHGIRQVEVGPFHGLVLESRDREPFHFAVAVAVRGGGVSEGIVGDELIVVEVFYPTGESLENWSYEIVAMLEEVDL